MKTAKLEMREAIRRDFESGLACDNVGEAANLISEGGAALKVSVYPWGAEFDLIPSDEAGSEDLEHE